MCGRFRFIFASVLAIAAFGAVKYAVLATDQPESPAPNAPPVASAARLDAEFASTIRPFLQQYCVKCHGKEKTEGDLDLAAYASMTQAARDSDRWDAILEKLEAAKMPPKKAKLHPSADSRRQVLAWFHAARDFQTTQNAGDPGVVLARRLSNDEYDYTIRDLTGVDIRPARQFPVDPANTAGFDNSGESLVMSPSLLKKYLQAAHDIASYIVLTQDGFTFAPYPILADTDRDKYCVSRIINFYHQQEIDYADYFEAAWVYKHRAALGEPAASLADIAAQRKISARYLTTIWGALEETRQDIGPLVKLQSMWQALPAPAPGGTNAARAGCERMRQYVTQLRRKVELRFLNIAAGRVGTTAEPLLIWKNVQYATHRMRFDPAQLQVKGEKRPEPPTTPEPGAQNEFGPGHTLLVKNAPGDPDLFVPAGQRGRYEVAFARFCRIFPDKFYMQERGRNYFDTTKDRGRYLSAGFHSLLGYFRDDQPLYELLLSDRQREELDAMWRDLDFIASASSRTYIQFCSSGQRGERGIKQTTEQKAIPQEDKEVTSELRIRQLEDIYLSRAKGGDPRGIEAIEYWFTWMNDSIRWTERTRLQAEPRQLQALLQFAERAYRRPLSSDEKNDVLAYYKSCRSAGLDHESAIREGIVSVLMSPDFCYRIDLVPSGAGVHRLSDYELANRLSYFLWSSMPDAEMLAHAAAGDLHQPDVLRAQTSRMLRDARLRALAVEFGGSWLDFRRFDEITTVDKQRFPAFTNELRLAMYEEPIHFLMDAFQSDRSMLDLIYGNYTFVNRVLAAHYGMDLQKLGFAATEMREHSKAHPASTPFENLATSINSANENWVRVEHADQYGRGGILPMAVFLTRNSPGLRTSPVKRGNWVVKNVLGERIAPPPPNVPELPHDESKSDLPLRQLLARHRESLGCAACHARFDSLGLVFEGFGPVGERRTKDLAGRAIDASATFPDSSEGAGLAGLRQYIRARRERDFTDNLSRKMLAYALGRSLILSDELLVRQIRDKLSKSNYRVDTLIESIVTSPQFLNKRGKDPATERRSP